MQTYRNGGWLVALAVILLAAGTGCGGTGGEQAKMPTASGGDPWTDAVYATKTGDTARLAELLDANPDFVNDMDQEGMTLLHFAAGGGNRGTAQLLLDRGADVNAVSNDDLTPLGTAKDAGDSETMGVQGLLKEHGGTL